jgi:hypothetical protein
VENRRRWLGVLAHGIQRHVRELRDLAARGLRRLRACA